MSLDYPYYQELCRRKHRAAWWWLVGDRLYYLGLLPAMLAVPGVALSVGVGLLGFGWHWLVIAAITFVIGAVLSFAGSSLKRQAYVLAERDGISSTEVYARGAAGGCSDADQTAAPDTGRGR